MEFQFCTGNPPKNFGQKPLLCGWVGGRWSKRSFNFPQIQLCWQLCYEDTKYRKKVCHQLSYEFENLMSSWGVWIWFSKLLWGIVFSNLYTESKVFQIIRRPQAFLSKFDVKLGSWGMIHTGKHRPLEVSTKPLPLPPGSSAGFTPRARSASLMGWGGLDGVSNESFNFLYTLLVYRTCIGLLIYMFKNCHQLCYGFKNMMSSWRFWISFSKLL